MRLKVNRYKKIASVINCTARNNMGVISISITLEGIKIIDPRGSHKNGRNINSYSLSGITLQNFPAIPINNPKYIEL